MKYISAEQAGKCGRFIKLPCSIFDSSLSPLAKFLYAYLLNLTTLSAKNGLCDQRGVYVFCTIIEASKILCCCRDKAIDYFNELEQAQLIYRHRCGLGKANRIYLVDSTESTDECIDSTESTHRFDESDSIDRQDRPAEVDDIDTNYKNLNYTDINNTDSNKTPSPPAEYDPFTYGRARCRIGYFSRKAAGEDIAVLEAEAMEEYKRLIGL